MPAAWKVIRPNKLNSKAMLAELKKPVEETIRSADKEFAKTYENYNHKPKFIQKFEVLAKSIKGSTLTSGRGSKDNPYPFVQRGTKSHLIAPRKAKVLAFQSGYKTKTAPNIISTRSGGPFGNTVFSKGHRVKGIKARDNEKQIARLEEPKFKKRALNTMKKIVQISGHAI